MTDAIGLLGLLLLAFAGRDKGAPSAPRGGKQLPGGKTPQLPPAPAPWPQQVPEGLPPFPGAGWVYDEPPPPAVQQRAKQLVSPLWRQGKGSHRTEQTAGRWITYRAELVRGGKQGVVAYRVKGDATLRQPEQQPSEPQSRAPSSPSSPSSWTLPMILTSTSAGWPKPQAKAGGGFVEVKRGQWYQWNARVDVPAGAIPDEAAFAKAIALGLSQAGAVNIAVSQSAPFILIYQLQGKHDVIVPLGVALGFDVLGVKCSITFTAGTPIAAPTGPKVPAPPGAAPPGVVNVSVPEGQVFHVPGGTITTRAEPEVSPLLMPDLKRGDKRPEVGIVQRKLGLKDDNVFGEKTQTAVIEFQKKRGLAPNLPIETLRGRGFGAVKQATWVALFGERA